MSRQPLDLRHLDDSALQALADGTLRGPEGFAAHEHCDACAECDGALLVYQRLDARLSALRDPAVPEDFTAQVLAKVAVREHELAQRRHTILAAVPALLLALFAIVGWMLSSRPAAHVDRLVSDASLLRHLFAALVPVFDAARLPLGLSALALTAAILFLLSRALRGDAIPAPAES